MKKLIHCFCSSCLLLFIVLYSSCTKDEDLSGNANLMFVNGMSDSNNCTLSISDSLYLSLTAGFGNFTLYNEVSSGSHTIKVRENILGEVLLEKNYKLSSNKFYTVLSAGVKGNSELILKEDDLTVRDTGKTYVRLINLCPNSSAMSLNITGGMDLATNVTYKSVSEFNTLASGSYQMTVKSGNTIIATIPNIHVKSNKKYSILLTGFVNQNPKASYNIIVNK
jgi:hypothetical protein